MQANSKIPENEESQTKPKNHPYYATFPCAVSSHRSCTAPKSVDSLLHCIDEAIDNSAQYVSRKEQRIRQLQQQLSQAKNLHAEYQLSYRLYEEYTPFVNDSAIIYLKRCIEIARKTGKQSEVGKCQALIAIRCSSTGKFIEALNTLSAIDTTHLDNIAKGTYYMAYNHVYGEIIYYRNPITPEAQYGAIAAEYRQRMYAALPPTSNSVFQCRELDALNAHGNREAMRINDQWLSHIEKGSHPYALVTLYRYLAYKAENDSTRMMYWLAESVLTDIKNGVMDQGSMWEMATSSWASTMSTEPTSTSVSTVSAPTDSAHANDSHKYPPCCRSSPRCTKTRTTSTTGDRTIPSASSASWR